MYTISSFLWKKRFFAFLLALLLVAGISGTALAQGIPVFQLIPPAGSGTLESDALSAPTDAWAVGTESNSDNTADFTLAEHWNGQSWSIVPTVSPFNEGNVFTSVADLSTSNAWAVGYGDNNGGDTEPLIEQWNGKSWNTVAPATDSGNLEDDLEAIAAVTPSNIWAVGNHFDHTIGGTDGLIEHWNGSSWAVVPSPDSQAGSSTVSVPNLDAIAVVSASNIWAAVGAPGGLGNASTTAFEHWNGSTWSLVIGPGLGSSYGSISSLAVVSANDIWAVGTSRGFARRSPILPLTEHWNGSAWSIVSTPALSTSSGFLSGVTALSTSNVWAVGGNYNGSPVVEQWNGSAWNLVSVPTSSSVANNQLSTVASLYGGTVLAVGPSIAILSNNG